MQKTQKEMVKAVESSQLKKDIEQMIKKEPKIRSAWELKATVKNWKMQYSLGARISIRIFCFLFPGVMQVKLYDTRMLEQLIDPDFNKEDKPTT